MLKKELKLSAPWVILYRKIEAMFKEDYQVNVIFDEDEQKINLYIDDELKAAALDDLLIPEHAFGNVTVKVNVIPPNDDFINVEKDSVGVKYGAALCGNRIFRWVRVIDHPALPNFTYVVFATEVAQYFSDDLRNPFGVTTTLYEDIAREIFKPAGGLYFCTAKKD